MTRSDRVSVGIASMGMYLPERVVTDAQIADDSGIEEWVICEKFGIVEKRMAGPKDQRNHMAYLVAQDCTSKSDISHDEIDLAYRMRATNASVSPKNKVYTTIPMGMLGNKTALSILLKVKNRADSRMAI